MPEGLNRHKGWNAKRDAVMPLLWQHPVQREPLCSLMVLDTLYLFFDLVKGMCIHDFTGYKNQPVNNNLLHSDSHHGIIQEIY